MVHHLHAVLPPLIVSLALAAGPGALVLSAVSASRSSACPASRADGARDKTPSSTSPRHGSSTRTRKQLEDIAGGLSITEVWLEGKPGMVSDRAGALGLEHFTGAPSPTRRSARSSAATLMLALLRYVSGEGDTLPDGRQAGGDRAGRARDAAANAVLPKLVSKNLEPTHLSVITKDHQLQGLPESSTRPSANGGRTPSSAIAALTNYFELEIVGPRAAADEDFARLLRADADAELSRFTSS